MIICPRCGYEPVSQTALILTMKSDVETCKEAYEALLRMKLALPDQVPDALRGIVTRWPVLARSMLCHAGSCEAEK